MNQSEFSLGKNKPKEKKKKQRDTPCFLVALSVSDPGKEFLMQIKFVSVALKQGFSPPRLPVSTSVYVTAA